MCPTDQYCVLGSGIYSIIPGVGHVTNGSHDQYMIRSFLSNDIFLPFWNSMSFGVASGSNAIQSLGRQASSAVDWYRVCVGSLSCSNLADMKWK